MKKLLLMTVLILIAIETSKNADISDWINNIEQRIYQQTTSTLKRPNYQRLTTELAMLSNSLSSSERHY